jgi:hypothetical protein|tara:strand:- start:515 stop:616 length:102 start_codon:yes stop_codon:yes gene_type:complete
MIFGIFKMEEWFEAQRKAGSLKPKRQPRKKKRI